MNINKALILLNEIRKEYSTMDGLKEYVEAIDFIEQELEQVQRNNRIKDGYLEIMHGLSFDYDGFNTVKGLKGLIDDLDDLTVKALKNDDKYAIYLSGDEKGKNILFEEVETDEKS